MSGNAYHLAQINVGRMLAPIDSPELAEFVAALDPVNAMADAAPGFVWRLSGEGDGGADVQTFEDPLILVNMSVWTDLQSLGAFVYRSGHREVMVRRRQFFEAPTEAFQALWWVPAGTVPSVAEGAARLAHLRRHGPTPFAFTFRETFAPDALSDSVPPVLDECA